MANTKWQRIEWEGGNMAGPAHAIKELAKKFDDEGTDYTVTTIKGPKTVRTTKKKVADLDLEVRGVAMPGGNDGGGSDTGGTTPTP